MSTDVVIDRKNEKLDRVLVSQASREMSKPAGGEVLTYYEESQRIKAQLKDIEAELPRFGKAAQLKEQADIRRQGGNTLQLWISRKTELESERQKLLAKKISLEKRLAAIKDRALAEKVQIGKYAVSPQEILLKQILETLVQIKEHLAAK